MVPEPESNPEDVVDRYRLSRLHSEGGLGRVWLAKDPDIGREVALKELLAEQASDPEARARFLSEARITGQLEHPNIVPVYDVGERDGDQRPYYTMRFVRGPTLADAIRDEIAAADGNRSWSRSRQPLLRALCSIGNAISHAHSRGIIHRDLKPDNIILGPHGELILLDWGLAKSLRNQEAEGGAADANTPGGDLVRENHLSLQRTSAGSVMGTIAYMSPEQADGGSPDERTDIYGLGAILFEILTGRPPHAGSEAVEVLREIVESDTPSVRSLDAAVPAALHAVCGKAMAKRPADRYAAADELVKELERWLNDEPVQVLPDSRLASIARWTRRHQGLAYGIAAAILLVSIVATTAAVRLGAAAERERGLRERSVQVSARLAARALGSEIDVRWSALTNAARSRSLRDSLSLGSAQLPGSAQAVGSSSAADDSILQRWIEDQFADHQDMTGAVSWLVQDRTGVQRARAPFSKASVGKSYAFRDYFHGQGQDLAPGTPGIAPIEKPHLSAVFQSQVTKNLMVAFAVPIWSGGDTPRQEVIGVLAMTVELGRGLFQCLKELGLDDSQIAVLVETRDDWTGQRGLVLQHPELVKLRREREARRRVDPFSRDAMVASHVAPQHVRHFVERRQGVLPVYRDAIGGDYEGDWLAAFEAVSARRHGTGNTTWVVVIQEREGED